MNTFDGDGGSARPSPFAASAAGVGGDAFLFEGDRPSFDFSKPAGEPALAAPESVSWQIFKNPCSLFIGGVAAVILELAEPRVRSGVWDHTSFRTDPVRRLRRTGLAAMITVYGPKTQAEAVIARVRRIHGHVKGGTPSGIAYSAHDPELLNWVHATAAFGFVEAYSSFVRPLPEAQISRFYAEGQPAAALYGALSAPSSQTEMQAFFAVMAPKLEPSPIIVDFLTIMSKAPILPRALRGFQAMLVRAGVETVPSWARVQLGLDQAWRLSAWGRRIVKAAAATADAIPLPGSPPVEASRRLGLPPDYLFGTR